MSTHVVFRLNATMRSYVLPRIQRQGDEGKGGAINQIVRRDLLRYYKLITSALPRDQRIPWEDILPRLQESFPAERDHNENDYHAMLTTLPNLLAQASPDAMSDHVRLIAEGWTMLQRAAVVDAIEQFLNADPSIPISDRITLVGLRAWH